MHKACPLHTTKNSGPNDVAKSSDVSLSSQRKDHGEDIVF